MKRRFERILETTLLALLVLANLGQVAWAGPPLPPAPSVPVGGAGVTIATTLVIAGYGIWKSRK